MKIQVNQPRKILESEFLPLPSLSFLFLYFCSLLVSPHFTNPHLDQMTIMLESARTFLWTEYARTGCGCLSAISTDPGVWDKLPVSLFPVYLFFYMPPSVFFIPFSYCFWEGEGGTRRSFGSVLTLQDKFSSYPGIKDLLRRVRDDKEEARKRVEFYHGAGVGRFDG